MLTTNLNKAQREVVYDSDGPVMVLAGAGSGKTRTLVSRVTYLLEEKNISPFRILALTFSNKAAREMKERVACEVDLDIGTLQMTTFHSFCARLLRSEIGYLGLSRSFTIYDDSESKTVVKFLLKRRGISPKDLSPYEILYYINDLKNNGFYHGCTGEFPIDEDLHPFFMDYETELHKANALDFGGLLTAVVQLFQCHPEVLDMYQKKFKYVLVDEYQDTNRVQFEIIKMLSEKHRNICVVGDEDQSIYSWRGADIRNILDFESVFPEAKVIKLEQNYRSSKIIIEAASAVIEKNLMRKGKAMWTDNPDGDIIPIIECADEKSEAEFVASEILKLKKSGVENRDVALFYRMNAQSRIIEDMFRKHNIAYRIVGGIKFYERKEIKDILAYLRLIVNDKDSLAFSRIVNVPTRGVGATTLRKLENEAVAKGLSLWEIVSDLVDNQENYANIRLTSRTKSSLVQLVSMMMEVKVMDGEGVRPSQLYEKVLHESGYYEFLSASRNHESISRLENLDEFDNAIKQFEMNRDKPTLLEFLETINLDPSSNESSTDDGKFNTSGEVSLMTAHGAKGLEYDYVFIAGAEENIFPSYRSLEEGEIGVEEERRLFYVAMTRAMKKLYIIFAQGRLLHGQIKFNGPSRYINEIPPKFFKWKKFKYGGDRRNESVFPDYEENSQEVDYGDESIIQIKREKSGYKFPAGSRIIHSLYGEGIVLETEGAGKNEKILIRFKDGIRKKFLTCIAPIVPF
ncbi:MAG: UvrD-helicase domain-containing protein [Bacteriovoracaceae bacterium]|nr:UvrD-helicase domain-containing protein [Bacteriovoracaceae bacterium]